MGEIGKWITEVFGEMTKDDKEDIAEPACADTTVEGKKLAGEDVKVCIFILKNLLKIKDIKGNQCNIEDADKEMKEYVYCTIINLWSTMYRMQHCNKENVVYEAYKLMKIMIAPFGGESQCEGCKYGQLEPMRVLGKADILQHINQTMNADAKIMKLINKEPKPKKPCPRTTGKDQSHQAEGAGGKMTAQQFYFLSSLLTKWIIEKGMNNVNQFGIGIWAGLGKMFDNLMGTLGPGEEKEIATSCATGMKENGEKITPWGNTEKELCKAMIKVMLYTNGLTQKLAVRDKVAGEDEVTTYLRCLVGTITLIELYGQHCLFGKVLPHVSRVVKQSVQDNKLSMTENMCYNLNLEEAKVGGKLIGATIKKWVQNEIKKGNSANGKNRVLKYDMVMSRSNICTESAGTKGGKGPGAGVTSTAGIEELQEVMVKGDTVSREDADSIIEEVSNRGLTEGEEAIKKALKNELEKIIQDTIQKQKSLTTLSIDQKTCSISGLDNQEQENWDELFTQFSNVPSDADKNGIYYKWVGMKSVCEVKVGTNKIWNQQEREFCEVLVRNLIIANEHKYKCEEQSTQLVEGKKKTCVGKCDLLTIWLTYVKGLCVSEELIKYAYEAMEQLETNWNGKDSNDLCKYGETSNLYRDNNDILNIIIEKMKCEAEKGRMKGIHNSNWCTEKYRKYKVNVPDGVARTGSSRQEPKKGKQLVDKLKDIENRANGQLDEVKNTVESHLSSSSSSGGSRAPKPEEPPAKVPEVTKAAETNTHETGTGNPRADVTGPTINTADAGKTDKAPAPAAVAPAKEEKEVHAASEQNGQAGGTNPNSAPANPLSPSVPGTPPDGGGLSGQAKPGASSIPGPQGAADGSPGTNSIRQGPREGPGPGQQPPPPPPPQHQENVEPKQGGNKPQGPAPPGKPQGPPQQAASSVPQATPAVHSGKSSIAPRAIKPQEVGNIRKEKMVDPSDFLTPYLPTIPVFLGISAMTYLFWKYFALPGKRRKRYGRAHQVRGPPPLEEQLPDHVDDQDGPHEYTLVKKRRQPRSVPTRRKEKVGKHVGRRGVGRRRMIIDIHLEVLDEYQREDLHSTKEDFLKIIVQEFMGCEFIEEENVPKEQAPSSDSGFREGRLCS
ncbi:SICA-like antigen [Plasmodium coatneyi]|uniref:SICA-like antigen n=1 Tax=Plasmodium coatneyi TaxID=208452 RepID=A0A1B1DY37_9APIC|nr:SICA-like antigen [Plasmodium coatneyi]ANQ07731.1 SICA-like antigen [Plasmodium coatneyi]